MFSACLSPLHYTLAAAAAAAVAFSRARKRYQHLPEVEIVHTSLHIAHVDVEGEEVDGGQCPAREDFEEVG